jgi:hypothetical protein
MRDRSYLGNSFEVWNSQRTWFWCVADPHHNGGTIGAAPTEVEAVREAVLVNRAHVGTIPCSADSVRRQRSRRSRGGPGKFARGSQAVFNRCLRLEWVSARTRNVECQ